jgi:phosphate transport system protein
MPAGASTFAESKEAGMETSRSGSGDNTQPRSAADRATRGHHALRDQDRLWDDFLAMATLVVDSLAKSVDVLCAGRLEVVREIKRAEKQSNRDEVRIEQECLRILALFEPVASDLRRMATILKVNRDWERIADLAARIAGRMRKLVKKNPGDFAPESLKGLARDVMAQVRTSFEALAGRDPIRARAVIDGDRAIDRRYRQLRRELKEALRHHAGQLNPWLPLMNTARNLERIADHARDIAETIIYLEEGIIIRHKKDSSAHDE